MSYRVCELGFSESITGDLAGVVVVIALLIFAEAFVHFRAAVDTERKPPRKW